MSSPWLQDLSVCKNIYWILFLICNQGKGSFYQITANVITITNSFVTGFGYISVCVIHVYCFMTRWHLVKPFNDLDVKYVCTKGNKVLAFHDLVNQQIHDEVSSRRIFRYVDGSGEYTVFWLIKLTFSFPNISPHLSRFGGLRFHSWVKSWYCDTTSFNVAMLPVSVVFAAAPPIAVEAHITFHRPIDCFPVPFAATWTEA